ncbi:uncharacterized protein LOC143982364 [Lithobates pipiens]
MPRRCKKTGIVNEDLIRLVQQRQYHWDSRDPCHKDTGKKNTGWQEIVKILFPEWDSLTPNVQKDLRERRLGKYEDTRDHTPPKEGQLPKAETEEQEEEEEGEIVEVGQIVTTTGDVEEDSRFTSESAQIQIGEIMGCNRDLENILQNINDVKNKMKNIIDVLGRV